LSTNGLWVGQVSGEPDYLLARREYPIRLFFSQLYIVH
jgi:hypothetical protein